MINARDYGLHPSASGPDNMTAWQSTLRAVAGCGGTVYVPAGRYHVHLTPELWLTVKSHLTVLGDGPATQFVVDETTGDYRTVFGPANLTDPVSFLTFRDFSIDQNPDRNAAVDLRPGPLAQFALCGFAATQVLVERVHFEPCCGINTVVFNGPSVCDVTVRDCRFRFVRGRTSLPGGEYDNSAIYLNGHGLRVADCDFRAALSERARGAIELHASKVGVVRGNTTDGYETIVNVVTQTSETPVLPHANVVITGNTMVNGRRGVVLWSATGKTLRNVLISGNVIALANQGYDTYAGVALHNDAGGGLNGDFENIAVEGNTISAEPENREHSWADSGGVLLYARGSIQNVRVSGNQITGIPTQAIRAHSIRGVLSNARINGNDLVDFGNNRAANRGYRVGVLLAGTVTGGCRIENNALVDTAARWRTKHGIVTPVGYPDVLVGNNSETVAAPDGAYLNSIPE